MNVEREQGKSSGKPSLFRAEENEDGHDDAEQQVMQSVVILREPQKGMVRMSGCQLCDGSQAIEVGNDSGNRHGGALAPVKSSGVRQYPPCQKVRDRTHGEKRTNEFPESQ